MIVFSVSGLPLTAQARPRARPSLLFNKKLKKLFLAPPLLPAKDRPSSTGAAQWGPIRGSEVGHYYIILFHFYNISRLADGPGPGQAVISEGGAGGRGAGPGEARVNGMPSKKSNSTSKLSAKG